MKIKLTEEHKISGDRFCCSLIWEKDGKRNGNENLLKQGKKM